MITLEAYQTVNLVAWALNTLVMVAGLVLSHSICEIQIVVKGSKVLDFVLSAELIHLFLCFLFSESSFQWSWVLLHTLTCIATTLLGEYICIRLDQQDIIVIERLFKRKKVK